MMGDANGASVKKIHFEVMSIASSWALKKICKLMGEKKNFRIIIDYNTEAPSVRVRFEDDETTASSSQHSQSEDE